jgi:hypothetical protein
MPLALVALVYFLDEISHVCLRPGLDHELPISASCVTGIIGMSHYTQPLFFLFEFLILVTLIIIFILS